MIRAFGLLLVCAFASFAFASESVEVRAISDNDADRYRRIFALQEIGDMKGADRVIAELDDELLMGHVLFQRYLSPKSGKVTAAALKEWLKNYSDHPGADRIYTLARKRGGAGLTMPVSRQFRPDSDDSAGDRPLSVRSAKISNRVDRLIEQEKPSAALNYINDVKRQLSTLDYDVLAQRVAWSFYLQQKDEKALEVANEVATRNGDAVPLANWVAGLASFRMGDYPQAAQHFDAMARADLTSWLHTAAAFWAARAHLLAREPVPVTALLEQAARKPRTFYGLLSLKLLGRPAPFQWTPLALDARSFDALIAADPAIRRGIALAQAGQIALAEAELVRAHGRMDSSHDMALAAVAERLGLAATLLNVSSAADNPNVFLAGLYPVPGVEPDGGYMLDRALVLAFMRAESKFDPAATSPAGARGLMQIMPKTAVHLTGDRTLATRADTKLYDPAFNAYLGEQYLQEMMEYGRPTGNIFMLATAYNGGPGNLEKWLSQVDYKNDPLLFIESIPSRETRGYIERVLASLWIYYDRFGENAPTLDDVAAGRWPVYTPVERKGRGRGPGS